MAGLFYFSSTSGNTARFVARLGWPAQRLPQIGPPPQPQRRFILICPTYADARGEGAVPKAVIAFLNDPTRRSLLAGVIGTGNRNFGAAFASAGALIARKCAVPLLYRFELAGNDTDLARVSAGLTRFWRGECSTMA